MVRTLALSLAALLAGCSYNSFTPEYDAHFGDAVRAARLAQTLNPGAGTQPPVMGLDGVSANHAIERYENSFKSPPPVVNVINIGGSIGGGAGSGSGGGR
jgi:uncharacterized lipoprotein